MKSIAWPITLSLLANVLMAGWWLNCQPPQADRRASVTTDGGQPPSLRSEGLSSTEADHSHAAGPRWKDFQTSDLEEMIRRLRNAGCPEETIKDLILAEVNREYAARSRSLWPNSFQHKVRPYWETQKALAGDVQGNRAMRKQQRQFQKEKSNRLIELLGVDPEVERRKAEGLDESPTSYGYLASRVAFLPEAKREAALNYLEQFEDKMQDFYLSTQGLWDSEARAEQRQLEAERLQGLAQVLTPQEAREYDLRNSQTATQLAHDLHGLSVSREQYEAIFDLRRKYGDTLYNYADSLGSKAARDAVEQNQTALKTEIAEVLGRDFARQYARAQDYSYRRLMQLAKRNDFPADTAGKVYDVKDAAEQNVKLLREDLAITDEQRQEALKELRNQTEQTIKDTLGEPLYQRYLNSGGGWIRNVAAPLPSSRVSPLE